MTHTQDKATKRYNKYSHDTKRSHISVTRSHCIAQWMYTRAFPDIKQRTLQTQQDKKGKIRGSEDRATTGTSPNTSSNTTGEERDGRHGRAKVQGGTGGNSENSKETTEGGLLA